MTCSHDLQIQVCEIVLGVCHNICQSSFENDITEMGTIAPGALVQLSHEAAMQCILQHSDRNSGDFIVDVGFLFLKCC